MLTAKARIARDSTAGALYVTSFPHCLYVTLWQVQGCYVCGGGSEESGDIFVGLTNEGEAVGVLSVLMVIVQPNCGVHATIVTIADVGCSATPPL